MKLIIIVLFQLSIIHEKAVYTQVHGRVQMVLEGPIQYIVTDSRGRKEGRDPRTGTDYSEIPNAGYGLSGVDSEDPDIPALEVWEFGFNSPISDPFFRETYSVEVIGTGRGMFTGVLGMTQTLSGKGAHFEIKGVIDSAQSVFYTFNFSTDSTETPTMSKNVTPSGLRQDLDNCFKLNLINNRGLYTSLKQKAENAIRQYEKGQGQAAVNLLQAFLNELKAQTDKGIDKDAARILTEDAQALIEQWKK
jgi:hypothetical protein